MAEGDEILTWVQEQPGVRSARMNIVEDLVDVFDWLEIEIDRRITATKEFSRRKALRQTPG